MSSAKKSNKKNTGMQAHHKQPDMLVGRSGRGPTPQTEEPEWKKWSVGQIIRVPFPTNAISLTIQPPESTPESPSLSPVSDKKRIKGTLRLPSSFAIIAAIYSDRMIVLPINNDSPEDTDPQDDDENHDIGSYSATTNNPVTLDVIDRGDEDNKRSNYRDESTAAVQSCPTCPLGNFLGAVAAEDSTLFFETGDHVNLTKVVSVEYGEYIEHAGDLLPTSINLLQRRYAFVHGPVAQLTPAEQDVHLRAHLRGEQTGYEPNANADDFFTVAPSLSSTTASKKKGVAKPQAQVLPTGLLSSSLPPPPPPPRTTTAAALLTAAAAAATAPVAASSSSPPPSSSSITAKISRQRANGLWDCGHTGLCTTGSGANCSHACCKNGSKAAPLGWKRINKKGVELAPLSKAHTIKREVVVEEDEEEEDDEEEEAPKQKRASPPKMGGKKRKVEAEEDETEGEEARASSSKKRKVVKK